MKKAYFAINDVDADYQQVIFANSAQEAKKLAYGYDGFEEYINIRVTRMPSADKFANDNIQQLNWSNIEHQRFFRQEGWWYDSAHACSECGLYEYEDLPESMLDEYGICVECNRRLYD